jgi:hypothetical protein
MILIARTAILQARICHVIYDADNCAGAKGRESSSDGMPDRLSIGEKRARKIAVDNALREIFAERKENGAAEAAPFTHSLPSENQAVPDYPSPAHKKNRGLVRAPDQE